MKKVVLLVLTTIALIWSMTISVAATDDINPHIIIRDFPETQITSSK